MVFLALEPPLVLLPWLDSSARGQGKLSTNVSATVPFGGKGIVWIFILPPPPVLFRLSAVVGHTTAAENRALEARTRDVGIMLHFVGLNCCSLMRRPLFLQVLVLGLATVTTQGSTCSRNRRESMTRTIQKVSDFFATLSPPAVSACPQFFFYSFVNLFNSLFALPLVLLLSCFSVLGGVILFSLRVLWSRATLAASTCMAKTGSRAHGR